jgi:hypothetical protein
MNLISMKKIIAFLSVFICFHLWLVPAFALQNQKFRPSEKAYKWADKQLKKMTVNKNPINCPKTTAPLESKANDARLALFVQR